MLRAHMLRVLAFALIVPLCALFSIAYVNDSVALIAPDNGTLTNSTLDINVTFTGPANVTIEYNTTGSYTQLNSSPNLAGNLTFSNASLTDGTYSFRITLVNATDMTDNATIHIENLTIDRTAPNFTFVLPLAGQNYSDGQSIVVNISIGETGSGIADNANCFPAIETSTSNLTGSVRYYAPTNTCNGTVTIVDPSGTADGTRTFAINLTDQAGNRNTTGIPFELDNTPPLVESVLFSDNSPQSNLTLINITVNASDAHGISVVQLDRNFETVLLLEQSANATHGSYRVELSLSQLGCVNDSLCNVNISVTDNVGNTNSSVQTYHIINALYVDASAPVFLDQGANVSQAIVGQNITVGALWRDVSLWDVLGFSAVFEVYSSLAGAFAQSSGFGTWDNSFLNLNWTNVSYIVNGSDEGQTLVFRVTLTDNNSLSNTSDNISIDIANGSTTIDLVTPADDSFVEEDDEIIFELVDEGVGVNLSTFAINLSQSGTNTTYTYAQNSSQFDCSCAACSTNTTSYFENISCAFIVPSITEGNFSLFASFSDEYGTRNETIVDFFLIDTPEVVNISLDGTRIVNTTSAASYAAGIASTSRSILFNWTVETSASLNMTTISLVNTTYSQLTAFASIPAGTTLNLTAGKNYVVINATLNDSTVTDGVRLNITANVPVNFSALADQYAGGLTSAWQAISAGAELSDEQFVNLTFDVIVNLTNATDVTAYVAMLNYSNLTGLALRWNATPDAFDFVPLTASERSQFANETQGNITIALRHAGQTALFFDEGTYALSLTVNVSPSNRTFYYGDGTMYLLSACASTPVGAIDADEACRTNTTTSTTLYLPRLEGQDAVLVAEPDARAPNLTIATPSLINQSVILLDLSVVTPNPNTTLCYYNLSRFNATANTTTLTKQGSIARTSFSLAGGIYSYTANLTGITDASYNLTVTCWDDQGDTNITVKNITVADSTSPSIYNVEDSGVGNDEATISGEADELVTFTVKYGTSSTSLSSTKTGDDGVISDSIDLNSLSPDTLYYYNLTACDDVGLCSTSSTGSFRTVASGSSSGGGGGGGGGADPDAAAYAYDGKDSRLWTGIEAGQRIGYDPRGISFSHVEFTFSQAQERAELTFTEYANAPPDLPAGFSGKAYRYLYASHYSLEEIQEISIDFLVEKEWAIAQDVDPQGIVLLRYESGKWVAYKATQGKSEADAYTYNAQLPGFSWLAIGVREDLASAPAEEEGDNGSQGVVDPVQSVEEQPAALTPAEVEQNFVSALDRSHGISPIWKILGLVALISLLAVGGLKYYQYTKEKEVEHAKEVQEQAVMMQAQKAGIETRTVKRPAEHDPMAQLYAYIAHMREKGYPDDHIKTRLKAVGWDEIIIEQEMLR